MITYLHSGTLGDLIYSLSIVRKLERGKFLVAINNINDVAQKYMYCDPLPEHQGRFTALDYKLLSPLLRRQSYIDSVDTWKKGDEPPTVDLDRFREILFKSFNGNYVEAYHKVFEVPFTKECLQETWLEADPKRIAPYIVCRSMRYRNPKGDDRHRELWATKNFEYNAVFIGNEEEHKDYINTIGHIPRHKVRDFLEFANVIAGSDLVVSNQTFAFSLAMGLGKPSILETRNHLLLKYNECYFPRSNVEYIE